jgi:hypothetical protein
MNAQNTKYIYIVKDNMPEGTIVVTDDEYVFPSAPGDWRVPIGVLERDCKQGERVAYDPSGETPDISHAILTKGLPYTRKPKVS